MQNEAGTHQPAWHKSVTGSSREVPGSESPGALAGATGAKGREKASKLSPQSYTARERIASRDLVPDWSHRRLSWKRAVARDSRLPMSAKFIAAALVDFFANRATARCNPFLATIAEETATPPRTVQHALGELERHGWIARIKGNGRGRPSVIIFTADPAAGATLPENVAEMAAYRPGDDAAETTQDVAPLPCRATAETTQDGAGNHATRCASHSEPKDNLKARARSAASRPGPLVLVEPGSHAEKEWRRWLRRRDLPDLEAIACRAGGGGGWLLPQHLPPDEADATGQTITLRRLERQAALVSANRREVAS